MAHYLDPTDEPEKTERCGLCHKLIPVKKMPFHLMKCKKTHQNKAYIHCPFNRDHIIMEGDYETHIKEQCKDKGCIGEKEEEALIGKYY